jgi:hypothetical protein
LADQIKRALDIEGAFLFARLVAANYKMVQGNRELCAAKADKDSP